MCLRGEGTFVKLVNRQPAAVVWYSRRMQNSLRRCVSYHTQEWSSPSRPPRSCCMTSSSSLPTTETTCKGPQARLLLLLPLERTRQRL